MRALNVNDFIYDLDRVKAVVSNDSKTVSLIEKLQYMINEYEKQHSIEAEPARHGRWVKAHGMMPPEYFGRHKCSLCGHFALSRKIGHEELSNYCPNCGAKMDLGKD